MNSKMQWALQTGNRRQHWAVCSYTQHPREHLVHQTYVHTCRRKWPQPHTLKLVYVLFFLHMHNGYLVQQDTICPRSEIRSQCEVFMCCTWKYNCAKIIYKHGNANERNMWHCMTRWRRPDQIFRPNLLFYPPDFLQLGKISINATWWGWVGCRVVWRMRLVRVWRCHHSVWSIQNSVRSLIFSYKQLTFR